MAAPKAGDEAEGGVTGLARSTPGRAGRLAAEPPAAPMPTEPGQLADSAPSMLIRTGDATIEVESVDTAIVRLRQIVQRLGGAIANQSVAGGREQPRFAAIELRIPSHRFAEAVSGLSPLGRVESVNIQTQDVGEEYVDLEARLANARRLESRLIELLRTRTGKLADVLSVERELARVREQIERHEGRARYLRARVAMSTLTVHLHEPRPVIGNDPGENPLIAATRAAWRNLVRTIAVLIESVGALIPLAAIALAGWWGWRRWRSGVARPGTPAKAREIPDA